MPIILCAAAQFSYSAQFPLYNVFKFTVNVTENPIPFCGTIEHNWIKFKHEFFFNHIIDCIYSTSRLNPQTTMSKSNMSKLNSYKNKYAAEKTIMNSHAGQSAWFFWSCSLTKEALLIKEHQHTSIPWWYCPSHPVILPFFHFFLFLYLSQLLIISIRSNIMKALITSYYCDCTRYLQWYIHSAI